MSTTGMITVQNCPRDVQGLLNIKRGIRYRLALHIGLFNNVPESESGFLQASDNDQCQALAAGLQQFDANGGGGPAAPEPPPQAQQPAQMTFPAMAPAQPPPMAMPPAQPPQAAPMTMPVMPPVQPPSMAMPPMSQPVGPQAQSLPMPGQMMQGAAFTPPVPPPPKPTSPQPPPTPQPSTASDPSNAGGALGSHLTQKLDVITRAIEALGKASETKEEWLQEIHDSVYANSRGLYTVVLLLVVLAENLNMDDETLLKLMKAKAQEGSVAEFFATFAEEDEDEGKE